MHVTPVTLEGKFVRLEPLSRSHHADLCEVGLDRELWRVTMTLIRNPDEMKKYIEAALKEQSDGKSLPFAIVEKLPEKRSAAHATEISKPTIAE